MKKLKSIITKWLQRHNDPHIESLKVEIRTRKIALRALEKFRRQWSKRLNLKKATITGYFPYVDINNPTREEVERVLSMVSGGKWKKSVNSGDGTTIDYVAENFFGNGVHLRLWNSEPPSSCKIVEVEELVPEHKAMRRKIICAGEPTTV